MKKILICLFAAIAFTSALFADSIGKRWFELKTNVPFGFYNNGFALNDIFQEEIVIDPAAFADSLKFNGGLVLGMETRPEFSINLNIKNESIGFDTGVEVNGSINISKSLFDFVATGNKLNEEISVGIGGNFDVFAYERVNVRMETEKYTIGISPSVFCPAVHVDVSDTALTVLNDEDGAVNVNGKLNLNIFTAEKAAAITNNDFFVSPDSYLENCGLDMGIFVKVPLFLGLNIVGNSQIPIFPGKFSSVGTQTADFSYKLDLMNSGEGSNEPVMDFGELVFTDSEEKIHRPMTFMAGVEFSPLEEWLVIDGEVGFGLKYPFSKKVIFYPQYQASAKASVLRIIGAKISTEYINQMFKHEFSFMLNARALEIDTGVSLYGADFVSSLRGTGFGGYITFTIGF
ncbi:MAG: DUF5723 family protein [Treponema sp.]|nr:DUF5723 family protein [Treponema sp.]